MQRATTKLRALVNAGKFLELPAIHDPLTARLAESIGFKTIYNGGFVTGGSTTISEKDYITARQGIEDMIGLEEYYKIERATVEKLDRKKSAKRL